MASEAPTGFMDVLDSSGALDAGAGGGGALDAAAGATPGAGAAAGAAGTTPAATPNGWSVLGQGLQNAGDVLGGITPPTAATANTKKKQDTKGIVQPVQPVTNTAAPAPTPNTFAPPASAPQPTSDYNPVVQNYIDGRSTQVGQNITDALRTRFG